MVRYTTPTFRLILPNTVDLTLATNVYVTFAKTTGGVITTKTGDALEISEHQVDVYMSQEETGKFSNSPVQVQLNWTYQDGESSKRACSNIVPINVKPNLLNEVIE